MQGYNVIIIFNKDLEKLLFCKRRNDPYKGMINFVGGKIEPNEESIDAAYRELEEETGITKSDTSLTHLMDFTYYLGDCYVEVWVGKLNEEITLREEKNALFWSSLDNNFFDLELYAGEGNIGHMLEHVRMYKDVIFKD